MTSVTPSWYPGQNPTLNFYELLPENGSIQFEPAQLSPIELQMAQDLRQGQLRGLIAVPAMAIFGARNSGQSRFHAEINGRKFSLSELFEHYNTGEVIVVGVYDGKPEVTGL